MRGVKVATVAEALAGRKFVYDSNTGCLLWQEGTDGGGYPRIKFHGKPVMLHRYVAASRAGRELQPGEVAMHVCDRPRCLNPFHLIIGSQGDNMRDMAMKGRGRGRCSKPLVTT